MSGNSQKSLLEIHKTHRGKVTDKWSGYFDFYHRAFQPFRSKEIKLLEIGIQNGGSLEVWSKYFEQAETIVGVDINTKCIELDYEDAKIKVIVNDVNRPEAYDEIISASSKFDIIIDDGSHTSGDIIRTFCRLFPLLEEDGLFVVEDICCSYWGAFDGGLYQPFSSMNFFKEMSDCINSEHWGNNAKASDHLRKYLSHYGVELADEDLAVINSIEFCNSIAAIRKAKPARNVMGKRVLGGKVALIEPAVVSLDGEIWTSSELDNPWAYLAGKGDHQDVQGDDVESEKVESQQCSSDELMKFIISEGLCPVCNQTTSYTSDNEWFRDFLLCDHCGSIPRERAFAWCLNNFAPAWRDLTLHESSPVDRSISGYMMREAGNYIGSHFYPGVALGKMHKGYRCENLENLTFADESIDLHCHLDVLEHVNEPEKCFFEMERTLKLGGHMIFTTPIYEGKITTERRARYEGSGIKYYAEAEYHGNPIDDTGSLVTFHYGSDFADLIRKWVPNCDVNMITLNDAKKGILGKFREVFVVTKRR